MKSIRVLLIILLLIALSGSAFADSSRLFSFSAYPVTDFGSDPAFPPLGMRASARYWFPPLSLRFFEGLSTIQGLVDYVYRLGDFTQFYVTANGGVSIRLSI